MGAAQEMGPYKGSSESIHVKMSHGWNSHVAVQMQLPTRTLCCRQAHTTLLMLNLHEIEICLGYKY